MAKKIKFSGNLSSSETVRVLPDSGEFHGVKYRLDRGDGSVELEIDSWFWAGEGDYDLERLIDFLKAVKKSLRKGESA